MPSNAFLELVNSRVAWADRPWENRIAVTDGRTLPFIVERSWSGAAGNYIEQWSIRREMRDIMYKSEPRQIFVRGLQSLTKHTDRVNEPIALDPGSYRLVFVVEGYFMGSADIEVVAAGSAAA